MVVNIRRMNSSTLHSISPRPRYAMKCAIDRHDPGRVRRAIAEHCGDHLTPETLADVQFVASELVTNAVEHGKRGVVTVDVVVDAASAELTVTSSGNSRGMPHPVDWTMPEEMTAGGRGLAFTRMLSSTVELHTVVDSETGDWVSVTAHIGAADDATASATIVAA